MKIRNENDITTADAYLGPTQMGKVNKTATTYNEPGLPKPPGGWGKKLGFTGFDEGPRSRDEKPGTNE